MAEDTKTQEAAAAAKTEALKAAGEAFKKGEAPKTVEEAALQLEYSRMVLKETTDESIKRKEKLRALDQEKADREAAALKEKGQYEELVKTLEPKAKRADELEKTLQGYFDQEVADVPEEKRSLIPDGPLETRLTWLKNAKSQGIFGAPKQKPADSDDKKAGDKNAPDFLSWAPTDKRLETLSIADYERWKKHNGRDGSSSSAGPAGWGGMRS